MHKQGDLGQALGPSGSHFPHLPIGDDTFCPSYGVAHVQDDGILAVLTRGWGGGGRGGEHREMAGACVWKV